MSEGLGDDVDCADKSIVRDSTLAPVPRNDRAFERGLRFVQLWRLLRFSSAAQVDTVNVNLLIRLFRARRSPQGSRTSDDRGWTSRKAASRHHPVISAALLAGRNNILSSSRPTDTAKRYRSSLQPKALNDSL